MPTGRKKGTHLSEESKAKMRESIRLKWLDPVWAAARREKMAITNKTRPYKPETGKKIGDAHRGQKRSDETRKRMRLASKKRFSEHPVSPETGRKISASKKGKPSKNRGKMRSEAVREKISIAKRGK